MNAAFQQYGMDAFPEAKTPEEAKADIRESSSVSARLADARAQANDFANAVFEPDAAAGPDNLATVAKQRD